MIEIWIESFRGFGQRPPTRNSWTPCEAGDDTAFFQSPNTQSDARSIVLVSAGGRQIGHLAHIASVPLPPLIAALSDVTRAVYGVNG